MDDIIAAGVKTGKKGEHGSRKGLDKGRGHGIYIVYIVKLSTSPPFHSGGRRARKKGQEGEEECSCPSR